MHACSVTKSFLTLCDPTDYRLPDFYIHEIFQEWGASSSSRGSSGLRDQTHIFYISCTGKQKSSILQYKFKIFLKERLHPAAKKVSFPSWDSWCDAGEGRAGAGCLDIIWDCVSLALVCFGF